MDKVKLKYEELEVHLNEQLELLKVSCKLYDEGIILESKRIAVIIRILFYDSKSCKSLLGQLGKKGAKFYSTNLPLFEKAEGPHSGLTRIGYKGKDTEYYPKLDDMLVGSAWLSFKDWWDEIVFRDEFGNLISREKLITTSANQDGGAHVDGSIDEVYYNLSKNNSLGVSISDGKNFSSIPNAEKAAIRQIGHEVLKTFFIDYKKETTAQVYTWLSGLEIVKGQEPSPTPNNKKIGRNEQCPCDRGKKYKYCHGKWL